MEKLGIENVLKAIAKLKEVVESGAIIMADGKIGFSDVTQVPELYADVRDMILAVQKAQEEAKDFSADEVKEVLSAVLDLGVYIAKKFGMEL